MKIGNLVNCSGDSSLEDIAIVLHIGHDWLPVKVLWLTGKDAGTTWYGSSNVFKKVS